MLQIKDAILSQIFWYLHFPTYANDYSHFPLLAISEAFTFILHYLHFHPSPRDQLRVVAPSHWLIHGRDLVDPCLLLLAGGMFSYMARQCQSCIVFLVRDNLFCTSLDQSNEYASWYIYLHASYAASRSLFWRRLYVCLSVLLCVYPSAENLENYRSEIDVTG